MNKGFCLCVALALAMSNVAFARGGHHKSAMHNGNMQNEQYTESDCQTLAVSSARNDCMRWVRAHSGSHSHTAMGSTHGRGGIGMTGGTGAASVPSSGSVGSGQAPDTRATGARAAPASGPVR